MITSQRTGWTGIHVEFDEQGYWITDNNGGEQYIGDQPPTQDQIDDYRDDVAHYG